MPGPAWLLVTALILQSPSTGSAPPTAASASRDRPFQQFFQNLGRDIKRLPSTDTALIVGSGAAGAVAMHRHDTPLEDWVTDRGPASYPRFGSFAGNGWVQAGGAVGTYVAGLMAHDAFTAHVGSDLIRAQALNGVLTRGTKLIAQRKRPSGGPDSMPSGHTSAAFATAAVLQSHLGWAVGAPAYAAAGFVGWSRIRDSDHWLTDIIVGAVVGTASGHTVTLGHDKQEWAVVPTRTAGGAAVYLVRR